MSGGAVQQPVQELLREHIESFDDLEVLLLLFRKGQWCEASSVSDELQMPTSTLIPVVEHLCEHGLVERNGGDARQFRYLAATPRLDEAVGALNATYAENRLAVMKLMNTNAVERIRNSGLRIFAESFRVKGRKKDG